MVLPPQYEEMRRARVDAIPLAFQEVLSNADVLDRYELRKVDPPRRPNGWTGPVARPSFEIYELGSTRTLVARILPDGSNESLADAFAPLLEKMLVLIEAAGQKAHDDFLTEYARLKEEDAR